jgi:hypothetical protein
LEIRPDLGEKAASLKLPFFIRIHLKNRILVQDRGGAEFETAGILLYVEDLKRGTNKDIGPKDIFEMGSNKFRCCPAQAKIDSPRPIFI